jgi:hypothetical protein
MMGKKIKSEKGFLTKPNQTKIENIVSLQQK